MRWRIEIKSILCNKWCSGKTIQCCVRDIVRFIVLCKWHCVHISFGCGCRRRSREQGPLDCRWASPPPPCSQEEEAKGVDMAKLPAPIRLIQKQLWYASRGIQFSINWKERKISVSQNGYNCFTCHSMLYKIFAENLCCKIFETYQNSNDAFTVR